LLGHAPGGAGPEGGLPELEAGFPETSRMLASEIVYRHTGQYVTSDQAVELVSDPSFHFLPTRKQLSSWLGLAHDPNWQSTLEQYQCYQIPDLQRNLFSVAAQRQPGWPSGATVGVISDLQRVNLRLGLPDTRIPVAFLRMDQRYANIGDDQRR